MNLSVAVNIFLRQTIRENGIPVELKLDIPNGTTDAAIAEGRRLAYDRNTKGFSDIDS